MSKTLVNNGSFILQTGGNRNLKQSKSQKGVKFEQEENVSPAPTRDGNQSNSLTRSNTAISQSDFLPSETSAYSIIPYYSVDTYDSLSFTQEVAPFAGRAIDEHGRLLLDSYIDPKLLPETIDNFISCWQKPHLTLQTDWGWTSPFVWPDNSRLVKLIRMDIYEKDVPRLQIGTIDHNDSLEIRNTPDWYPVRSLFFMNVPTDYTTQILIESMGPPRRSKYRPHNKQNSRDLTKWNLVTKVFAFNTPMGIPGTSSFFIDYQDFPDRYFITNSEIPTLGQRRLYQFATYSATQYYILEKQVHHETLDAEGGTGYTYYIEAGPVVYAKKDWRIIGSFYGFDHQLTGSSQFTIYRRQDPFPRMVIALQNIERAHEWNQDLKFFAFDIPVPGTAKYSLQHCLRSIYSNTANVSRHRLTTEDPRIPWEFRMNIFTFPAQLDDCTIHPYDVAHDPSANYGVAT